MTASKIEWTDRSDWNPIRGCTRVSPGCGGPGTAGGCYAEAIAARFSDPGQPFHGYATRTTKGPRWTGKVAVQWDRLELPLRWRQPARIFASSTSDFFHPALTRGDVAVLFGVMIAAHHLRGHTFQVLTKRADIMREWLNAPEFWEVANEMAEAFILERTDPLNRRSDDARATCDDYGPHNPPPGIWLGVSVEDQTRADERRDDLRATPAVVRFVSYEPALGPVDWTGWDYVHQIIGGGESGPNARPMHPAWQRATRDWCTPRGIAYFFKQWGEFVPCITDDDGVGLACYPDGADSDAFEHWEKHKVVTAHGREFWRVGKKAAGRLLDGVEHNGMPGVQA